MMNKNLLLIFSIILLNINTFAQTTAMEFLNNQMNKSKKEIIYIKLTNNLIQTNITTIDDVNDSILLSIFNHEIVNSLEFYGLDVKEVNSYPDELKENEHTLEISQMEIEQYNFYDSITDEYYPKLKFYKQLNGIKINVWLTFDAQNENNKLVFYNEEQIGDALDGYFECIEKDSCFVNYEIVNINPNDLYLITFANARNSAEYFFNFLLNRYVYIQTNGLDTNYYGISNQRMLITRKQPFNNFDIVE